MSEEELLPEHPVDEPDDAAPLDRDAETDDGSDPGPDPDDVDGLYTESGDDIEETTEVAEASPEPLGADEDVQQGEDVTG